MNNQNKRKKSKSVVIKLNSLVVKLLYKSNITLIFMGMVNDIPALKDSNAYLLIGANVVSEILVKSYLQTEAYCCV